MNDLDRIARRSRRQVPARRRPDETRSVTRVAHSDIGIVHLRGLNQAFPESQASGKDAAPVGRLEPSRLSTPWESDFQ
jgi:hypothetical protein